MGLLSTLFGSSEKKAENESMTVPLPEDELSEYEEAALHEEFERQHREMEAHRVVDLYERGMYSSWREAKMKNPQLDRELEREANAPWRRSDTRTRSRR